MKHLRRVCGALLCCAGLLLSRGASAQSLTRADLTLQQSTGAEGAGTWRSVAPAFDYLRPRAGVTTGATLVTGRSGLRVPDGHVAVRLVPLRAAWMSAEVGGELRRDGVALLEPSTSAALSANLLFAFHGAGLSVGTARTAHWVGTRAQPGLETSLSAWADIGAVTLLGSLRHRGAVSREEVVDTLRFSDPSCHARRQDVAGEFRTVADCARSMASLDVDAGVRVRLRALEVEGRVGTRPSARGELVADSRIAGLVRAEYSITRRVSVVSSLARVPSDLLRGLPARTQTFVGLRLQRAARHGGGEGTGTIAAPTTGEPQPSNRSAPAAFEVGEERDGLRTIYVVAPDAHSVELTGDMTRWRVAAMTRTTDGRWSVALRLPPGVYSCNVRIDGGRWAPPAGLPTSRDDFRGEVGIVVIE